MKKIWLIFAILFFTTTVLAQTNVHYFYSTTCSHCANVAESGILEKINESDDIFVEKFSVSSSQDARNKYMEYVNGFALEGSGVPFAVIEQDGQYSYLMGDEPIINDIENAIENFEPKPFNPENNDSEKLTWSAVILAAIIDSINPCAFGVLIFLMASLLRMGSSKRALKAGLTYSLVIFLTYFVVGIALYGIIDAFSNSSGFYFFYLVVSIAIFILGIFQLKDVFWYGQGFTLRISPKVKPMIENFMSKGTIASIIILGVLVSLFELPCTGEIYLGILTMMHLHQTFGIWYLLVYNIIFILPLIILTYLVYKGTSVEKLQNWTVENRKYMKLISGLLLVGLAAYIFIKAVEFI